MLSDFISKQGIQNILVFLQDCNCFFFNIVNKNSDESTICTSTLKNQKFIFIFAISLFSNLANSIIKINLHGPKPHFLLLFLHF